MLNIKKTMFQESETFGLNNIQYRSVKAKQVWLLSSYNYFNWPREAISLMHHADKHKEEVHLSMPMG